MSITYQYVDPAATGLNTGVPSGTDPSDPTDPVNWNDAWNVLQSGVNAIQLSGVIYCRGIEYHVGAGYAVDLKYQGDNVYPYQIIGCNPTTGAIDGSKYEINGSGIGGSTNGLFDCEDRDNWYVTNVRVANSAGAGFHVGGTSAAQINFYHCEAIDNNGYGFDRYYASGRSYFVRCLAENNTVGFYSNFAYEDVFLFCVARNNSNDGFRGSTNTAGGQHLYYGCLSHDNNGWGFNELTGEQLVINCVADNNATGGFGEITSDTLILGCRVTNHDGAGDIGIQNNGGTQFGWNYFANNTTDVNNTPGNPIPDSFFNDTNIYGSTDGFVDASGDNYNLAPGAQARTIGVELP